MSVIQRSYHHLFDWGSLWAPHNENRIFFPNLVVLALSRATNFNIIVEEFLSAVLLLASVGLIIGAHRRRSPETPWLNYVPVAVLLLSLVQYQDTLWGFQLAWYIVMFSLAAALFFLDIDTGFGPAFVLAMAAAVIGSFSSLQGLFIWPVGLLLLLQRGRRPLLICLWAAVGALSAWWYSHHIQIIPPFGQGYARHHLLASIKFFLFAIGDVLGVPIQYGHPDPGNAVVAFGTLIVVLAVTVILVYGIRRDATSSSAIGVALVWFGLIFAASITDGRILYGYSLASQSRYTTFDLLVPVGIYLAALRRPPAIPVGLSESENRSRRSNLVRRARTMVEPIRVWFDRSGLLLLRAGVAFVIVIQIPFGLVNGIAGARTDHAQQVQAVAISKDFDQATDGQLALLDLFTPPAVVRRLGRVAQRHHLSVFGSGRGR